MTRARELAKAVKPGFMATISANTSVPTGGGVLPFNSVTYDARCFNNGGHYNTSNYRFTVPTAGKYSFSLNVNIYNATGVIFMPGLLINGTIPLYGTRIATNISGDNNGTMSLTINLQAGDYVQPYAYVSTGQSLSGGTAWNSFSGMWVSE